MRTKIAMFSVAIVLAMAFAAWSDEHSNAARAFLRGVMRQLF